MIYLDNAATTRVMSKAAEAAAFAMTEDYGNPSSLHKMGIEAEKLIDFAKARILSALGDPSGSVIFTSGATESNNTAIFGLANTYGRRKKRVVTTSIEHPSVARAFERLSETGYSVSYVHPNSDGEITAEMLASAVDDDTCLISAMLVNNENGYILPIGEAFSKIKRAHPECMTHCDCVQGFEKLPISAKKLCADVISISGHKIYAPKGVGAMYLKKGVRLSPVLFGGGQQKGLRSGTEAVPLIYALGVAVSELTPTISERLERVSIINEYAKERLLAIGAVILSGKDASPYILSIAVPGIKSETMLHFLEQDEIYVSGGSACSKGKLSAVPTEFGVGGRLSDSIIRLSFSADNLPLEIDRLCQKMSAGMAELAKIKY